MSGQSVTAEGHTNTTKAGRNQRILVIDDNQAIHADFRKILCPDETSVADLQTAEVALFGQAFAPKQPARFEVDSASQGNEGLALVEKAVKNGRPYSLAFVDVRMPPGWDGIETTARLWQVDPDLQVVICTAYSDYSWDELTTKIGSSDRLVILKKPFDHVEALQLAHALTEKWQLLQKSKRKLDDLEKLVAEKTGALKGANALLEKEVAEHKQAATALKESALLLDLASDAIFVRDFDDQRIHFWNKGAERLYGWTGIEAKEGAIAQALLGDELANKSAQDSVLEKGEWNGEMRRINKSGERITVNSRWTLLRDADGNPASILTIDTDITEKKKLETQFLRTQRLEAIGTLATGMAHDLNNILAPILIATEMLRWPLPRKDFEETVNRIENSTKRGAEIIKQVLTFGRGVSGERVPLQLGPLLEEMVAMTRETFPKNIEIRVNAADGLWPIRGDRTQIQQVLLNLCVNARDAAGERGLLFIDAANVMLDAQSVTRTPGLKPGAHVLLRVIDNGSGIPAEILDRIFDPFFTTKPHGKGTGLGLSTVMGIVKSHGGLVGVTSEVGKGTAFKIFLPASPEARTADGCAEVHIPRPEVDGAGRTILMVDDEAEILLANQAILERYQYSVLTAADGEEALNTFRQKQHCVKAIITDMVMPRLDGLGLIKAVRSIAPSMPIIASSGLGRNMGRSDRSAELESLGVAKFLMKPYTADMLVAALQEILKGTQKQIAVSA
jgi:two-component system cell cycle sensor histidine kinase/response regulator CckA